MKLLGYAGGRCRGFSLACLFLALFGLGPTPASGSPSGCFGGGTADGFEQYYCVFEGVVLEGKRTRYPDNHRGIGDGYWTYSVQILRSWKGVPSLADASWLAGSDVRPGVVTVEAWDPDGGPRQGNEGGVKAEVPMIFYAKPGGGGFRSQWTPGESMSVPACGGIEKSTAASRCVLDRVSAPENAKVRPPLVDTSACSKLSAAP